MVSSVSSSSNVVTTGSSSRSGTTSASTTSTTTTGQAAASSVLSSTTKKLNDIESQLASFADSAAKARKKADAQAQIQVQSFEKQVRKSPFSTNGAATDIGTLIKDTTRLNVYSNLKGDDKGDVFKVRVQSSGEAQLGLVSDPGLRFQVLSRFGAVVADSKSGQGQTSKNFEALRSGDFKLTSGDYYIKVTNDGTGPTKDSKGNVLTSKNYAIQVSQGIYSKDYDTVAQQARPGDGVPQQSPAQLELQNLLTASTNFDTGLSGTQKLTNALFG